MFDDPRPVLRRAGASAVALVAAALAAVAFVAGAGAARADTAWGPSGASYSAGIVCSLPDGRRVALARWDVDGRPAFSTSDVVARGSAYGPAPTSGATSPLTPGQHGLAGADIAGLAYLIGHDGTTSVAETSADVAAAFGDGSAQAACLGGQGTTAAHAAAIRDLAARYAGPYTVQVGPAQSAPGVSVPVSARVVSADGVATPGVTVTFAVGGADSTAVTGADGIATTHATAPATPTTAVTATVNEATGLTWIATDPASVTLAATTAYTGTGTLSAILHPTPAVSVSGGSGLVLSGGTLTPTATVSGTYGYAGTGTLNALGPVQPQAGASCSSLGAADYAAAPSVWSGSFSFTGDGPRTAGSTGALRPGCYGLSATVTVPTSVPVTQATANAGPSSAVDVSDLQVTQSVGSGLATSATLAATVTAAHASGATVTSTLTTYGPLTAASGGRCDGSLAWDTAKAVGTSAPVALGASGSGDTLAATLRAVPGPAPGCYALVARSTVSLGGRNAVVASAPGTAGTTASVLAPSVSLDTSAYDGRQGVAMTGSVHVLGTFAYPATVSVGLVSAPATISGCQGVSFPSTPADPARTTVATTGDGDYTFRTPVPTANRCYGIVARLAMSADPRVAVDAPAPGDDTVFLAGAVSRKVAGVDVHVAPAAQPTRALAVFAVAGAIVVLIALVMMINAAVSGERRPDPRGGELLVDLADGAVEPLEDRAALARV